MDPTKNSTYNTLWLLLREAAQVFPDSYLHLGGDEVPFDCWQVKLHISSRGNIAVLGCGQVGPCLSPRGDKVAFDCWQAGPQSQRAH